MRHQLAGSLRDIILDDDSRKIDTLLIGNFVFVVVDKAQARQQLGGQGVGTKLCGRTEAVGTADEMQARGSRGRGRR